MEDRIERCARLKPRNIGRFRSEPFYASIPPGLGGEGVAGSFAVGAAGAGDVVARTDSARGSVEGVQATVADPTGAAMSTADSRVSGAVSAQAPVDPEALKA